MTIFGINIKVTLDIFLMTPFAQLLNEQHIFPNLKATNKKEVLMTLISSFKPDVSQAALKAIEEAVFERERIMSTGVGKGLAIPHGKVAGITQSYAAFGLLESPIEYQAIDGEPVSMIFLLVGPKQNNSLHIKMLSRISRLMNDQRFRESLKNCDSSKSIISLFEKEVQEYFPN